MIPLIVAMTAGSAAQSPSPEAVPSRDRLSVSIYDTAATLPVRRTLGGPVHPGVELGLAHRVARGAHLSVSAVLYGGAFVHRPLVRAATLDVGLRGSWRPGFGLVVATELGVGALAGPAAQAEFVADGVGGFEKRSGRVRAAFRGGLRLAVGWGLGRRPNAPELLAYHRVWVETPFAPGFIPLVPHGDTGLALDFPLPARSR